MRWIGLLTVGLMLVMGPMRADQGESKVSPDQAYKKLVEGNRRYAAGKTSGPNRQSRRRAEVAKGQHPFAIIVSCSDSRVPPELLFDRGLGDLFVTRLAGNIVDDPALGSIEYGVAVLGAKLILVLGHSKCGAVDAAVKGGTVPGHIPSVVEAIQPAVEKVKGKPGKLLDNAIEENVRQIVERLKTSDPILAERVKSGKLKVVGGVYDLDTGKVVPVR